jgi:hypothetical protein
MLAVLKLTVLLPLLSCTINYVLFTGDDEIDGDPFEDSDEIVLVDAEEVHDEEEDADQSSDKT